MLDFDVSKLAVVAAVALIVLGPERLPRLSRTVGTMAGRAKRYFDDVKAEVNSQIELDEVRKLKSDIEGAVKDLRSTVSGHARDIRAEARKLASAAEEALPVDYLPSIHDSVGESRALSEPWRPQTAPALTSDVQSRAAYPDYPAYPVQRAPAAGRSLRPRSTPVTPEIRANHARRSVARSNFASIKAGKRSALRSSAGRARNSQLDSVNARSSNMF
jgi:sec-independent protein translocase protein TatB